jgi:hypothetical protein
MDNQRKRRVAPRATQDQRASEHSAHDGIFHATHDTPVVHQKLVGNIRQARHRFGVVDANWLLRKVAACGHDWQAHGSEPDTSRTITFGYQECRKVLQSSCGVSRLKATCAITEGEPKRVLLETAHEWGAHCIFVEATGLRGLRRLPIGSVSSGVANAAACTVEVVRRLPNHVRTTSSDTN